MSSIRKYLAAIGRRGGLKSRRSLNPATARGMVKIREARRAFHRFHSSCFWSYRSDLTITQDDVPWVAEQLMKHGNREAWQVGSRLCHYSNDLDFFHDSAWRFMPLVRDPLGGWLLHPVDLAINKVLALAGRDEPRDFVDILFINARVLPLGAVCWAAAGKDPGFTPLSLLELLKRRGRYRPEEFARLDLAEPFDLMAAKMEWLAALDAAEAFIRSRPPDEIGCLYWSTEAGEFAMPTADARASASLTPHFGTPGGVLPQVRE